MIRTKYSAPLLILISTVLIGGLVLAIISGNTFDIKAFDVNEYQYYIEHFPSNENIGSISDTKELLKKVENIWIECYGESIKREKPYQLFYDKKSDTWLVKGTLRPNLVGGVANIIIEGNSGKVLAIWHDK